MVVVNMNGRVEGALRYVNAYELNKSYGGPEEGGWWYTTGIALASIPVRNTEQEEAAKQLLEHRLRQDYAKGNRNLGSVNCEGVLEIRTQDHTARDFPQERPRYE